MSYPLAAPKKYHSVISAVESEQCERKVPKIHVGDEIKVNLLIQEGNKERVQPSQGTVIAYHRAGLKTTVTIRRVFQGVGFERVLPIYSPMLQSIEIIRQTKVRRAKLYYLRGRVGKSTRLTTKLKRSAVQNKPNR